MTRTESRRQFINKGLVTSAGLLWTSEIDVTKAMAAEQAERGNNVQITIEDEKKVYSTPDGRTLRYNAFTNMEFWHGKYYIAFRQGVKHSPSECRLVLIESTDLENWTERVVLNRPSIDDRDPKLLSTPDRLFLYTVPYPRDSEVMSTQDGVRWTDPVDAYRGSGGDQFWKPKFYNGSYYVASDYNNDRVDLLKSTDGLSWRHTGTILEGTKYKPTEIAIVFLEDGRCLALLRMNNIGPSGTLPGFAISSPPYTSWDLTLGKAVRFSGHAVERFGDTILVASRAELGTGPGRWDIPGERASQRTVLYTFNLETMRLEFQALLPSEHYRDSSYVGLVKTGESSALMSWHDGNVRSESNIWLARIRIG
ncbi:MAG: hypothetical protein H8E66_25240 [Planctomycetes bacterium]|nr:hypothetical protein [Planctomycetota bacterium]